VLPSHAKDAETYDAMARGFVRQRKGREAVSCYRQALQLKPDFTPALKGLGDLLRWAPAVAVDEVLSCYREAIRLEPDDAEAHSRLGFALKDAGLLDEAISSLRRAAELRPESASFRSSLLDSLHFHPDYDAAALAAEHAVWNQRYAAPLAPIGQRYPNTPDPNRRLRIGYVSPNFNNQPVGRFVLPLLAAHDRDSVEIFCYSAVKRPDRLTERLRAHAHHWRDAVGMTDERLAELVRQDGIDILVDLDSHTPGNRLLMFARKPAPVQVTYLAYCSTTGMPAIDYRLTDPFFDPIEQPRFYAEESIWLPDTYWCYEPLPGVSEVAPSPALANGYVTYGCLNSFYKVTTPALTMWCDVLRTLPTAKLILHARPGSHRDRVRAFFAARHVDPDRIEFMGMLSPLEYFACYGKIDIGVDPFPFAGGTTTCDAVWMGVPMITLAGQTAVGRAGVSILANVGLSDLVARNPSDYVRLCTELASDVTRLAALRAGLRDRMRQSALMNAPRFARDVEAAFRGMWRRWCEKDARSCCAVS
jgi:predicted O-linked N-acetylglucosamine transferase (SPINDLY family)